MSRGKYYEPTKLDVQNCTLVMDPHGLHQAKYIEDMKEYRTEVRNMKAVSAKLYTCLVVPK
jgi:hypothetical protein